MLGEPTPGRGGCRRRARQATYVISGERPDARGRAQRSPRPWRPGCPRKNSVTEIDACKWFPLLQKFASADGRDGLGRMPGRLRDVPPCPVRRRRRRVVSLPHIAGACSCLGRWHSTMRATDVTEQRHGPDATAQCPGGVSPGAVWAGGNVVEYRAAPSARTRAIDGWPG